MGKERKGAALPRPPFIHFPSHPPSWDRLCPARRCSHPPQHPHMPCTLMDPVATQACYLTLRACTGTTKLSQPWKHPDGRTTEHLRTLPSGLGLCWLIKPVSTSRCLPRPSCMRKSHTHVRPVMHYIFDTYRAGKCRVTGQDRHPSQASYIPSSVSLGPQPSQPLAMAADPESRERCARTSGSPAASCVPVLSSSHKHINICK